MNHAVIQETLDQLAGQMEDAGPGDRLYLSADEVVASRSLVTKQSMVVDAVPFPRSKIAPRINIAFSVTSTPSAATCLREQNGRTVRLTLVNCFSPSFFDFKVTAYRGKWLRALILTSSIGIDRQRLTYTLFLQPVWKPKLEKAIGPASPPPLEPPRSRPAEPGSSVMSDREIRNHGDLGKRDFYAGQRDDHIRPSVSAPAEE